MPTHPESGIGMSWHTDFDNFSVFKISVQTQAEFVKTKRFLNDRKSYFVNMYIIYLIRARNYVFSSFIQTTYECIPFKKIKRGNKYMMMVVDYFVKFRNYLGVCTSLHKNISRIMQINDLHDLWHRSLRIIGWRLKWQSDQTNFEVKEAPLLQNCSALVESIWLFFQLRINEESLTLISSLPYS